MEDINNFVIDRQIIDIKYQVAVSLFGEQQIYCFSASIIYKD